MNYLLIAATLLVISTVILGIFYIKKGSKKVHAKKLLGINGIITFSILTAIVVMFASGQVSAAHEPAVEFVAAKSGLQYLAAALSTGLAAIGAGIAVAVASSAALGAISEDPNLLGKTLIFVGLAEGIAIYGLIVSILILYA